MPVNISVKLSIDLLENCLIYITYNSVQYACQRSFKYICRYTHIQHMQLCNMKLCNTRSDVIMKERLIFIDFNVVIFAY